MSVTRSSSASSVRAPRSSGASSTDRRSFAATRVHRRADSSAIGSRPTIAWPTPETTLELLRLGLDPDLFDVQTATAGGHVSLAVEFAGSVGQVTAFQLSDGHLAYLAFVALVQLDPGRTALCFDGPEQHLHPALLARVVQLLEDASTRHPVVIATHSDHLLDYLSDPVASVLICELDAERRTTSRRLDPTQLDTWLEHYGGVGEIRAGGQLESVLAEPHVPLR